MKLEVMRGIECGERVSGDESGHCRVCGDGHAEGTRVAALLSPPLHPINNTPNNQSKPIVPTPSLSLSYNFSL